MIRFSIIIVILALLTVSCAKRQVGPAREDEAGQSSVPLFDPLATAQDREVVPEVYPVMAAVADAGDSLVTPGDRPFLAVDSTASPIDPREMYRVQVFTSRLYSEAMREKQLAEEIFNLPIYLDYEVPYYKLRVGDYLTRDEAETMLEEIKSIGYRNAWVARVVLQIREVPELGPPDEPILPEPSADSMAVDSSLLNDEGDDL